MPKHKIYKYFLLEFFKLFLLISGSLSILLWMSQATRLLELVTEYGNSLTIYLQYTLLIFPKTFKNTLDLSFLITLFFLFSKFNSSREILIYWVSGISKYEILKLVLKATLIIYFFYIFLSIFFAPWTSYEARKILASSKFSLINSLVKEKNFNSPLKGLTIYVEENNQKGKLKDILIFDSERTIIAKEGTILSDNNKSYLEIEKGLTQEKVGGKINFIKFDKTVFDFSKYNNKNIKDPKFSERSIVWIFDHLKKNDVYKKNEIREESNRRLIKPFIIFILALASCFLLKSNNEKKDNFKFYTFVFFISILLIIFNEYLLNFSSLSLRNTYLYLFSLISIFFTTLIVLIIFLKKENF